MIKTDTHQSDWMLDNVKYMIDQPHVVKLECWKVMETSTKSNNVAPESYH